MLESYYVAVCNMNAKKQYQHSCRRGLACYQYVTPACMAMSHEGRGYWFLTLAARVLDPAIYSLPFPPKTTITFLCLI